MSKVCRLEVIEDPAVVPRCVFLSCNHCYIWRFVESFMLFFLSVISVASGDEECDSGVGKRMSWNDTTAAAWNISVFSLMNRSHLWIIKSRSVKTWRNILWRKSLKWMTVLQPGGVGEEGGGVMKDQPGHTYKKKCMFFKHQQNYSQWALFQEFAYVSSSLYHWKQWRWKYSTTGTTWTCPCPHHLTFAHIRTRQCRWSVLPNDIMAETGILFFLFYFFYFVTSYNRFSSLFHDHYCYTLVL